jgi:hypothetical protein
MVGLLDQALDDANLFDAWLKVRANKEAAGVDGQTGVSECLCEALIDWPTAAGAVLAKGAQFVGLEHAEGLGGAVPTHHVGGVEDIAQLVAGEAVEAGVVGVELGAQLQAAGMSSSASVCSGAARCATLCRKSGASNAPSMVRAEKASSWGFFLAIGQFRGRSRLRAMV